MFEMLTLGEEWQCRKGKKCTHGRVTAALVWVPMVQNITRASYKSLSKLSLKNDQAPILGQNEWCHDRLGVPAVIIQGNWMCRYLVYIAPSAVRVYEHPGITRSHYSSHYSEDSPKGSVKLFSFEKVTFKSHPAYKYLARSALLIPEHYKCKYNYTIVY